MTISQNKVSLTDCLGLLDNGIIDHCHKELTLSVTLAMLKLLLLLSLSLWLSLASNASQSSSSSSRNATASIVGEILAKGLSKRIRLATTEACVDIIEKHFLRYLAAIASEAPLSFEGMHFPSQCDATTRTTTAYAAHSQRQVALIKSDNAFNSSHSLVMNNSTEKNAPSIRETRPSATLLYVLLMHTHEEFAVRLIRALHTENTRFVVHIDSSAAASVLQTMIKATERTPNVLILPDYLRERVAWGGFSIVNATLSALRYTEEQEIDYDFAIIISGTSYPLKSNAFIQKTFTEVMNNGTGAAFVDISPSPFSPSAEHWQHYVECDGALHRIGRLSLPRGMQLYQGSQWMALPRDIVHWLLHDPLPLSFAQYAQHALIPDESYFQSLIMNSPFCSYRRHRQLTFVLFDQWEHEKPGHERDPRKCLSVEKERCGRSPVTLTMEHLPLLQTSSSLFARKFDPLLEDSMRLVDAIDRMREKIDSETPRAQSYFSLQSKREITSKRTKKKKTSKCIQFSQKTKFMRMQPCDRKKIDQLFAFDCFENEEANTREAHPSFDDLTCQNSDSLLQHSNSTRCLLKKKREGEEQDDICFDIAGESMSEDAFIRGYQCTGRWNQVIHVDFTKRHFFFEIPTAVAKVRGMNGGKALCLKTDAEGFLRTFYCDSFAVDNFEWEWSNL